MLQFTGFYYTHNAAIHLISALLSEIPGYFLPIFAFSQVPFTHIITKIDLKILYEQQVVILILIQPVKQGLFLLTHPVFKYL
jgi:hypothetical protein